jgi:hypothetical protein
VPAATAPVQLDLDRDRLRGLLPGLAWMTGVPQLLGGDHAAIVSWLDSATEKELRALDDVVHLAMLLRLVEWTALTGGAEVLERDGVA